MNTRLGSRITCELPWRQFKGKVAGQPALSKRGFQSHCGATFDEIASPLGQGGTSGVSETGTNPPRRSATAVAVVRPVAEEHDTPTTPAVAIGPGIPSSTEEGSLTRELRRSVSDRRGRRTRLRLPGEEGTTLLPPLRQGHDQTWKVPVGGEGTKGVRRRFRRRSCMIARKPASRCVFP